MKIQKIYPRDIIGGISLIACFILMGMGINSIVYLIAVAVITYYFSKRIYEEKNGYEEKPRQEIIETPKPETPKPVSIERPIKSAIPPFRPGVITKPVVKI